MEALRQRVKSTMAKVIIFKQKGDWKKSRKFLKRCSELDLDAILDQ